MIQLIFFLFIGLLLFGMLFLMARRNPRAEGSAQALVEARHALNALQTDLLPGEFVGRVFAKQDRDYIVSEMPASIQKMFLAERKKIAVSWVRQVRNEIKSLRQFHRGAARFYAQLSVRTEIGLAFDFAMLLLACRALEVMLYLRGPYAVPGMVESTATAAARVCGTYEKSLAFLKSAPMGAFMDRPAGGVTA